MEVLKSSVADLVATLGETNIKRQGERKHEIPISASTIATNIRVFPKL